MLSKYLYIVALFFSFYSISTSAEQHDSAISNNQSQSNFYVGLLFGKADSEQKFDDQYTVHGKKYFQDPTSKTYGVYAGFNFNQKWAIEGGVWYLPDIDKRPSDIPIDDVYMTAFTLTPIYHFDLSDRASLFIKAGIGFLIYVEDFKKHGIEGNRHSDDDYWAAAGFTYGVGLEFDVSKSISTRFTYDYLKSDLEADDDNHHVKQSDVDGEVALLSLSMQYNF